VALQRLIVTPDQISGYCLRLTQGQQHYLYRVLRLGTGHQFIALDGQGHQWTATLTAANDTATLADIHGRPENNIPQPVVHLAVAIPKGSGFDDVVRQTTEMGVATLQPLITERTLHRPGSNKLDRWRRIAAEATEQSERLWLPKIYTPMTWEAFLQQPPTGDRYLCVARQTVPHLLDRLQTTQTEFLASGLTIATGPEGGWSALELDLAAQNRVLPVSLGASILRAVTAPLAALAIAQAVIESQFKPRTSD
jgi:16S rRNA (uracil1498-N3)-methyltransferase